MHTYEVRNCKALLGKILNWDINFVVIATAHTYEGKIIIRCQKRDTALFVRNNIFCIFKIKGATCIPTLNRALTMHRNFTLAINTKTITMY